METTYYKINPKKPELYILKKAAELLKKGEIVVFPTETVYGVGAVFYDREAVKKVFRAKERPADTPLLVHLSSFEQVYMVADEVPDLALKLMDAFWPGPLSLILPARNNVPPEVTGGKTSVGLRMPSHPVAKALIDMTGPLAATSANLSGRPSPVNAEHVRQDLDGRVALVLDAGETGVGLESTVLDMTGERLKVLRTGGLGIEDLERVLGTDVLEVDLKGQDKHYMIKTRVLLAQNEDDFQSLLLRQSVEPQKIGIVFYDKKMHDLSAGYKEYRLDLRKKGISFFSLLRDAEKNGIEALIFAPLPEDREGLNKSLIDRIYKAVVK
ncbi:L-threonylcarbamoyladenylate synthase [Thermosyntropha sp.]|uniref:L-threonylcarbamoyladenylate synthase n=1 Tax=Thermosyntropha sp. TaxID=2740820 RepID=UPI0025D7A059|nr:L-threonylcarbamoyladenylate synthase [Thermosyntropha sp.]MBO8157968.1 threonylcarbamoyl-AMP synthase [Thermosyntropha sp.]